MLVQRLDESLEAPPAKVSEAGVCARLNALYFLSLDSISLILNLSSLLSSSSTIQLLLIQVFLKIRKTIYAWCCNSKDAAEVNDPQLAKHSVVLALRSAR